MTKKTKDFPMPSLRVFTSYSHEDRKFVEGLIRDLNARGVDVWIDQHEICGGESIRQALERAISETQVYLIILSSHSVNSQWVQEEIDMMLAEPAHVDRVLIPLVIGSCEVPRILRGRKSIDFRTDYQSGLQDLLSSIYHWSREFKDPIITRALHESLTPKGSPSSVSRQLSALGKTAISIGRYREAVEVLKKAVKYDPKNRDAWNFLAGALFRSNWFPQAEEILKRLLSDRKHIARAHYNLACLYSRWAEALSWEYGELHDGYMESCDQHLRKAFQSRLISWLKQGGRPDPMVDILGDPDLVYARLVNSTINEFIHAKADKYKSDSKKTQTYGGGGCFHPDTMITMAEGTAISIKKVTCGDEVLAANDLGIVQGPATVWRKMRLWEDAGFVVNGSLRISASQQLLTYSGWKKAAKLEIGDILVTLSPLGITVKTLESWIGLCPVYHIALTGWSCLYANYVVVHNAAMK